QCQSDLAMNDPTVSYLKEILIFNFPIKDSFCFKNSSGGYCNLDPNSTIILNFISGLSATFPTDINCNDCNKAILNTFMNYFKAHSESLAELPVNQTVLESFQTLVISKCNSSFLDGTVPNTTGSQKGSGISIHTPPFIDFTMFANTII
ncbi:20039_t:CDS:2, partial [Gigaspora margarita]